MNRIPTVSVHTLTTTSDEKMQDVFDDGRFIDDLWGEGVEPVASTRRSFSEEGCILLPERTGRGVSFTQSDLGDRAIRAMHVRPLAQIIVQGSEHAAKLNPNSLKALAVSKIELYRTVLSDYQVPTQYLSMSETSYEGVESIIDAVATPEVVLKDNNGSGGSSTKIMPKTEALAWVSDEISRGEMKPQIVQPKISFGHLPSTVQARGTGQERALVDRARREELLTELRIFTIKRGQEHECVPILRIVPTEGLPMRGGNDLYVDVDLDPELAEVLFTTASDIIDKAAFASGGEEFALGAVDYYFDTSGIAHVMEANFRSPQLPLTRKNPVAGRQIHKAVASTLAVMASRPDGDGK